MNENIRKVQYLKSNFIIKTGKELVCLLSVPCVVNNNMKKQNDSFIELLKIEYITIFSDFVGLNHIAINLSIKYLRTL